MKRKKLLLAGTISALALTTLASCGQGGGVGTREIVFYSTMGDALQKVADVAIKSFEEKYPGWKITHQQPGGYDQVKASVISDLGAGTQPSLAYCYSDHVAQYLQSGKVLDMSKYINSLTETDITVEGAAGDETKKAVLGYSEKDIADFIPGYYKEGFATNYGDYKTYGFTDTSILTMPFSKSTEVLYYNADALEEAGIAKAPATWDELWDDCRILKKKFPDCTPLGYDSEANWFITMCEQNGWDYTSIDKPHYKFNNDGTVLFLEELKELYDEGLFTTQKKYGSYTSGLFTKGAETGSIFSIGSTGGATHQTSDKFTVGVAPLPGSELDDNSINKSVISQGPSLVMFDTGSDEKAKMTWLFVKELLEPKFQCQFSMNSGYNPVRESSYDNEAYAEWLDGDGIVAKTATAAKLMINDYFTSPAFNGSATAREQVGSALVYAFTGQKPAQKALKDAVDKCGD